MLFETSFAAAGGSGSDVALSEASGDTKHGVVLRNTEHGGKHRRRVVTAAMMLQKNQSRRKTARRREEYPPVITSLSPPEKMPSVLKRYHTSDGRLILRRERATHHEFFRAHRSNGRLRLELVSLNDVVDDEGLDGDEEDGGGIIQCGGEHGNTCSSVESQPSIKRLCLLGVKMDLPVHTL